MSGLPSSACGKIADVAKAMATVSLVMTLLIAFAGTTAALSSGLSSASGVVHQPHPKYSETDPYRLRLWDVSEPDSLLRALRDMDPVTRETAVLRLGEIAPDSALDNALVAALGDSACRVRGAASQVLEDRLFLPPLIIHRFELEAPRDPCVRHSAFLAIARNDPSALDRLVTDPSDSVRYEAAWAARMVCGTAAVPLLQRLLADPSNRVRNQAADWLRDYGPAAAPAARQLLDALRRESCERHPPAFSEYANALAEIGTGALQALTEGLTDPDERVRNESARAAGELGAEGEPLVPRLVQGLISGGGSFYSTSLVKIGRAAPAAVSDVARLLQPGQSAEIRRACMNILQYIGPGAISALPVIRPLLADPDPLIQSSALAAWAAIDSVSVQPVLLRLAVSDSVAQDIRATAIRAWTRMGLDPRPLLPALVRMTTDSTRTGRYIACDALRAIGPSAAAAVPALCRMLERVPLEPEAVEALEAIGPSGRSAVTPLLAQLRRERAREDSVWAAWNREKSRSETIHFRSVDSTVAVVTHQLFNPFFETTPASVVCALALVSIDPPSGWHAYDQVLMHGTPPARSYALQRIQRLGPNAAPLVNRVIEILGQGGDDANQAAHALGKMRQAGCPAVSGLSQAVRVSETRQAATQALVDLGSYCPQAVTALLLLMDDPTTPERGLLLQDMAQIDPLPEQVHERIERALTDSDPKVRSVAAFLLHRD